MAYLNQTEPKHLSLSALLTPISNFFDALLTANSRAAEVERLTAKSDAELAKMGLRREDIARYVFRDVLYL